MSHVNVCDLSVLPKMSKRRTELARDHHDMHVLKEDEIWRTPAEQVFKQLPSRKIASGFIQVYSLSKNIIQSGKDHSFLARSNGGIRIVVSIGYRETDKGLTRKDGRVFQATAKVTHHKELMANECGREEAGADDLPALLAEGRLVGKLSEEVDYLKNI